VPHRARPDRRAYRRRRLARLAAVLAVLGTTVGLALYAVAEENGDDEPIPSGSSASPTPDECDRSSPEQQSPRQYDAPANVLEDGVDYRAVIETSCGAVSLDLLEESAPEAVNSFVFLAREGFYDGLQWVRVEPRFLIQSGDPNNQLLDAPEGAGHTLPDRLPARPSEYVCGVVATTSTGEPDSGSSGFFIVVHDCEDIEPGEKLEPAGLQKLYSIFGRVEESSYDTIVAISERDPKLSEEPVEAVEPAEPIYIESVEIIER
jgi:cyclophilin family peptidyl-prolyl cis-trans isomerase